MPGELGVCLDSFSYFIDVLGTRGKHPISRNSFAIIETTEQHIVEGEAVSALCSTNYIERVIYYSFPKLIGQLFIVSFISTWHGLAENILTPPL